MHTTLKHLLEAQIPYEEAQDILRGLRGGSYAEVVLDSALPIRPGSSFDVSGGGRIHSHCLLMDPDVAEAFTLSDISSSRGLDGWMVLTIKACNVSKSPMRFLAWFVGRRLGQ